MPPRLNSLPLALFILALSFQLTACSLFRPAPFIVSPAVAAVSEFQALQASGPTRESYAAAFSPDEVLIFSSKVLAKVGRFGPKTLLDITTISAPPDRLRLIARQPGVRLELFDLVVDGDRMEISLPRQGSLYKGTFEPGHSPFGEIFGLEPLEIVQVLRLGGQLGEVEFKTSSFCCPRDLTFSDEVQAQSGLLKVRVDAETSLPRRAWWKKGGFKLGVRYLEWDAFRPPESDSLPRIYPTRLVASHFFPYLRVEVWGLPEVVAYRFPGEPHRLAFVTPPRPGTQVFPLSRFKELF